MPSILDMTPYPWHINEARQLHIALIESFPSSKGALNLAARAQMDVFQLFSDQAPAYLWMEILDKAAPQNRTRAVVQEARSGLHASSSHRRFLEAVLADKPTVAEAEPRGTAGAPSFIRGDDTVMEPEALLYYDDLTMQVGKVPALIATLQLMVKVAPSICKLTVAVAGGQQAGTAFRVADQLLLTNWHVLHDDQGTPATAVTAEFDYEDDGKGGVLAATNYVCDVKSIKTDKADDWAVISTVELLAARFPVINIKTGARPTLNAPAYIVQHPEGARKRIGFVRNQISDFDDQVVHYLTDTKVGSSGSPVFDEQGRVVALHHAGGRPQDVLGRAPLKKNEGINVARILQGFAAKKVEL